MPSKPFLFIEHDPNDPPGTLLDWLTTAGHDCVVLRPHAGDQLPTDLSSYAATVMLGGAADEFDWRSASIDLLQKAAAAGHPTLAFCLGAQLATLALGGRVERGADGMEVGPMQTGRKDVSYSDPLFSVLPMAPDVIQFHRDVITELPPGAVHLMGGPLYEYQAYRFGDRLWAAQFHIETTAEIFQKWIDDNAEALQRKGFDTAEIARRSAVVHAEMGEVWEPFILRFAEIAVGSVDE